MLLSPVGLLLLLQEPGVFTTITRKFLVGKEPGVSTVSRRDDPRLLSYKKLPGDSGEDPRLLQQKQEAYRRQQQAAGIASSTLWQS